MAAAVDLTAFIQAIVRTLVRWCLKRGVRAAQVDEILRKTFVQEAQREIEVAQGAFSVSKVSVMTGLNRTEVARHLSSEATAPGKHDTLNRVIGLWSSAQKYQMKGGPSRALTYEGLESEFAALVAQVSKEITHYPILFELERIGAIEYSENKVKPVTLEYTPREDTQYGLDLLSSDAADLASAVEANLTNKNAQPSLHLRTSFDNIDPEHLGEIRQWILSKGAEFHSAVREHLAQYDRDVKAGTAPTLSRARVTVTSFSIAESIQTPKLIMPKKRGRKKCVS